MTDMKKVLDLYEKIRIEISKVVIGKEETGKALTLALIAGGHVLIEGVPGTAKTTLASSFAKAIGGKFKRIQFTPDMMPVDITGFYVYSPNGDARFVDGPIFANIVLADELNRTTPRTQAALLEAMQENSVTIEKTTHQLAMPFMVIATQIKSGSEGTYQLTEVQSDRFLLKLSSGYASQEDEAQIIAAIDRIDAAEINAVTTINEIKECQEAAKAVHVSTDMVNYTVAIMDCIRSDADVLSGPSIRGGIALFKCSRVLAILDGRDYVIPDDIKHLAGSALEHRIRVKPEAEMDDINPGVILQRALERVKVPK